jgi:hypothetical protein
MHAEDLRRYLAEATGRPIDLRMNDNLHRMVSARPDGRTIRISLHRMFLDGDERLFAALAQFVHKPTAAARAAVRDFINQNHERIASARQAGPVRAVRGSARGKRFHLAERAAVINQRHFAGRLEYRIIWGKSTTTGRHQRHVTLGTWNPRQRIVRIHPMLDLPGVPAFMVDFVIYHEMVHIAVPSKAGQGGRMHHHSREFRAMEQRFPDYARAMRWEQRWIGRLISAWNGGPPLPEEADPTSRVELVAPRAALGSLARPQTASHTPGESSTQLDLFSQEV